MPSRSSPPPPSGFHTDAGAPARAAGPSRRQVLGTLAASLLGGLTPAWAEDATKAAKASQSASPWPARPVEFIVPAPPGSSLDVIARTLGEKLSAQWGQPVRVVNKPGAGGMIGMGAVARAHPDGYTLGVGFNGPIAFAPFLYEKMAYDPARDLLPIVMTSSQANVLAVPAAGPDQSVAALVARARQASRGLTYGSVGAGSSSHLTMERFRRLAQFEATHVAYAGSPPAGVAVASGEVEALFSLAPALLPLVQSGRVRLLATTGATRDPLLPELPTLAESGYADFEALAWNGLFAPAGTPAAVVAQVGSEVSTLLRDAAVRRALTAQGLQPDGTDAAGFARYIAAESERWGALIRAAGIRIE